MLLMLMNLLSVGWALGLLLSVVGGISQESLFGSWVYLELNMLMFISAMSLTHEGGPSTMIKYFIIQSVGSSIFLWAVALNSLDLGETSSMVMLSALSLKLGVAPFQGWFVSVLSTLSWELLGVASTLQKVLPVFLSSGLHLGMTSLILGASALVSVLGSISQTHMKKILAYSSVFMTVWLLVCEGQMGISIEYLLAYSVALSLAIYSLASISVADISGLFSSSGAKTSGLLMGSFLSLGGCPPLVGFYAKITVVLSMVLAGHIFWALSLMGASVFLLFIYMRIFYSTLSRSLDTNLCGSATRVSGWAVMMLGSLVVLPWLLCLGVEHSKIWTFSIK